MSLKSIAHLHYVSNVHSICYMLSALYNNNECYMLLRTDCDKVLSEA